MTKRITIRGQSDIEYYRKLLLDSSAETRLRVAKLTETLDPLELLYQMKFEKVGCDPMNFTRRLNLIEQLNQTFTYAASLKAAEYLLQHHTAISPLTLNLGTTSGWDIQGEKNGGVVAEVFAAVNPQNNGKIEKDIAKVAKANALHRYVFFMCPGIGFGPYQESHGHHGIQVVSLGCDLK